MKVKFLKKVKNKEKDDFFEAGKSYDLKKQRAEIAIEKGFAERVEPKSKKLQEKTIKK